MINNRLLTLTDVLILTLIFSLASLRAFVFFDLFPDSHVFPGSAWTEVILWALLALVIVFSLRRWDLMSEYWAKWRRNWPLGLFVCLALLSIFWSLDLYATLFRALELFLATLIAAYVGVRLRPIQMSAALFWFGALVLILSLATVLVLPGAGRMFQPPYGGAWRGIFWHKNHLGSIVALVNIVFGLRGIIAFEQRRWQGILDGLFYLLSLFVLYFSNSATGYILAITLHFFLLCAWLWLKVFRHLQKWQYYLLGGIFIVALILVLSNLDFVFGIFNRSPTMTGRVDLWIYLLEDVIPPRLWWGHGFGALWTIESFRRATAQQIGWGFQPVIADNGYLDILLHLGIVGFLIFLSALVLGIFRTINHAIQQKNLLGFLPFLIMFWALFANIAFSLFAETEVFVWSLIVAVLFVTTNHTREPAHQSLQRL